MLVNAPLHVLHRPLELPIEPLEVQDLRVVRGAGRGTVGCGGAELGGVGGCGEGGGGEGVFEVVSLESEGCVGVGGVVKLAFEGDDVVAGVALGGGEIGQGLVKLRLEIRAVVGDDLFLLLGSECMG